MILTVITLLALPSLGNAGLDFRLTSEDIKYISISPKMLGRYNVVMELFGPSYISLSKITGENIGKQIDVYISDTLIVSYPITYKAGSSFIGVGEFNSMEDAVAKLSSILTALDGSG